MIHIASEIVVVIGLTFYFNQKNKKLMSHIEDLSQKIEEQEDLLQKHEQIIKKLVESINHYQSEFKQQQRQSEFKQQQRESNYYPPPQQVQTKNKKNEKEIKTKSILVKPVLSKSEPKVSFKEDNPRKLNPPQPPKEEKEEEEEEQEEEEEEEEDSDLDAELSEELKELVSSNPVQIINVDTGLKKRSR